MNRRDLLKTLAALPLAGMVKAEEVNWSTPKLCYARIIKGEPTKTLTTWIVSVEFTDQAGYRQVMPCP